MLLSDIAALDLYVMLLTLSGGPAPEQIGSLSKPTDETVIFSDSGIPDRYRPIPLPVVLDAVKGENTDINPKNRRSKTVESKLNPSEKSQGDVVEELGTPVQLKPNVFGTAGLRG